MSEAFFPEVDQPIMYAGPGSAEPLTFRWYDADASWRANDGRAAAVRRRVLALVQLDGL